MKSAAKIDFQGVPGYSDTDPVKVDDDDISEYFGTEDNNNEENNGDGLGSHAISFGDIVPYSGDGYLGREDNNNEDRGQSC